MHRVTPNRSTTYSDAYREAPLSYDFFHETSKRNNRIDSCISCDVKTIASKMQYRYCRCTILRYFIHMYSILFYSILAPIPYFLFRLRWKRLTRLHLHRSRSERIYTIYYPLLSVLSAARFAVAIRNGNLSNVSHN